MQIYSESTRERMDDIRVRQLRHVCLGSLGVLKYDECENGKPELNLPWTLEIKQDVMIQCLRRCGRG